VTIYDDAVLKLLKDGPMRRQSLLNQLCPAIMSKNKLQKTLNALTLELKIIKSPRFPDSGGRCESWYTLPGQRYLLEVDAGKIIEAIERLKPLLLRMPSVDEIAVEVGITPSEAESLAFKFAAQKGWYNPTRKLIEDARVRLGEALVCAARIRDNQVDMNSNSKSFDYEEDARIVEEAKRFLKEYPKLLPTLSKDGEKVIEWPSEALRYLRDNYIPKDRPIPFFAAINRGTGERIF
jgi:hypothetical protein